MSSKDKNLPVTTPSAGLELQRAKSLVKLTDGILGGDRSLTKRNAWLDELIAWADENDIPEKFFPRNADEILGLKRLFLEFHPALILCIPSRLLFIPDSIGNLTNLEYLCLSQTQ